MDLGLFNRCFLITAASSGLGFAAAEQLVAERANVVLVARTEQKLSEAADKLGQDSAAFLVADLADENTAEAAVQLAKQRFGRLDGAFVSVGGPPKGAVLENTDAQWQDAFNSVFLSALRVARAVVAENKAARLGFVLSTSSKTPLPSMAISNGLRPGLGVLVKQLADEIGPDGGRAFGILPGSISTERMIYLNQQTPDPAATKAAAEAQIPLRRYGEPEELGKVAAFLLSDAASYVTGCLIPVDGGVMRAL